MNYHIYSKTYLVDLMAFNPENLYLGGLSRTELNSFYHKTCEAVYLQLALCKIWT
jgi:hypothetical protein